MDVDLIKLLADKGYDYESPLLRPDGFGVTVKEFAEQKNCSIDVARSLLNSAKDAKILDMHLMKIGGNKVSSAVYHLSENWPPENKEGHKK